MNDFKGVFPSEYTDILKLKGVGPYTAAAIASFAFDISKAVVDGNVIRVVTRYFGITEPVDQTDVKNLIELQAQKLIENVNPAAHNQAMMDFGATFCIPGIPDCNNCVMKEKCIGSNLNIVSEIPQKLKKVKVKKRYFHYLDIRVGDELVLIKRDNNDIWGGLYDFLMIEGSTNQEIAKEDILEILQTNFTNFNIEEITISDSVAPIQHILSHQKLFARFYKVKTVALTALNSNFNFVNKKKVHNFAIPRLLDNYLNKHL
jgi:A/G-specific adenine glycosylase